MRLTRRQWILRALTTAAGGALLPVGCARNPHVEPSRDETLALLPGKVPMRVVNDRPPCLETPWRYFRQDLTPNDAFYVRWHLQAIPGEIDVATWRLRIDGAVDRPLELSMRDLQQLAGSEVVAVNQCSGNSRGLFAPRVPGAQWGNGAMGNARWAGVSLATLLRRAGVRRDAVQVTFDGLDEGPLSSVPDFLKALDIAHALQPDVLIAYSMNGGPLPALNGFPARVIVPGWYATYWVKALHRITVLPNRYDGYWMAKAYKVPNNRMGIEDPKHLETQLVPISRMTVRSFFTTPEPNSTISRGQPCEIDGIAFDGGSGIQKVDVSTDGGKTWAATTLGTDLGNYSFRRWRFAWTPSNPGPQRLLVRATARDGQTQPREAGWNRGGYMRNVIEELTVTVA